MPGERGRLLRMNQENPGSYSQVVKTGNYRMTPRDTLVKCDPSIGSFTVTLPPVAECGGSLYVIRQVVSAVGVTTVVDAGDTPVAYSVMLNTATEVLVALSDGEQWYTMYNQSL